MHLEIKWLCFVFDGIKLKQLSECFDKIICLYVVIKLHIFKDFLIVIIFVFLFFAILSYIFVSVKECCQVEYECNIFIRIN